MIEGQDRRVAQADEAPGGGPNLPVVLPAAPGSPHLARACRAALIEGAQQLYVVSEEAPSDCPGEPTHVPVPATAGFAARANAGLKAAADSGYDAALLLNDDTEVLAGSLTALAEAIATPAVAVAGAVLLPWKGEAIQQAGIRVFERTGRIRVLDEDPGNSRVDRDAISGAAMAVDLSSFESLGGFCEEFTFYFEDLDYCLRARAAGLRVMVCGDARVRHREGGTRSRQSRSVAGHLGRSQMLFAQRLGGRYAARQLRLIATLGRGLGWTCRHLGPRAVPDFAAGVWTVLGRSADLRD